MGFLRQEFEIDRCGESSEVSAEAPSRTAVGPTPPTAGRDLQLMFHSFNPCKVQNKCDAMKRVNSIQIDVADVHRYIRYERSREQAYNQNERVFTTMAMHDSMRN